MSEDRMEVDGGLGCAGFDRSKVELLVETYEDIHDTLYQLSDALKSIRSSQTVNADHILALAERLSYSAFAPLGWKEGFPLHGKFPPAPQPDQMHSGKLTEYNRAHAQGDELVPTVVGGDTAHNTMEVDLAFIEQLKARGREFVEKKHVELDEVVPKDDAVEEVSQPTKKARTRVNLRFAITDSDDSDG